MPEAFAVLLVFCVSVFVYVIARAQARRPEHRRPAAQLATLRARRAWLEERLKQAERENWSAEMKRSILEQLDETKQQTLKLEPQQVSQGV